MEVIANERTLTELDHVRLSNLLRRGLTGSGPGQPFHALEEVVDSSDVVPSREAPADLVTMRSRVRLRDLRTGQQSELTLCYPGDAEAADRAVSVLSPIGSALLGLKVGGVARWSAPSGQEKAVEILAIAFQPEASGEYTL